MEKAPSKDINGEERGHSSDLELLRLRVLATRKRAKPVDDREEGELSEHEVFPQEDPLSPPPPPLLGRLPRPSSYGSVPFRAVSMALGPAEGSFQSAGHGVGKTKGPSNASGKRPPPSKSSATQSRRRAKVVATAPPPPPHQPSREDARTQQFFTRLSNRFYVPNGYEAISPSFEPQNCIVQLDSSDSESGSVSEADYGALSPGSVSRPQVVSPTLQGLVQKELQRQRSIYAAALSQLESLRSEMQAVEKASTENDELVGQVVAKQQALKAQLRDMKELIRKGKAVKADYSARHAFLAGEVRKKEKLAEQLQTSILAKAGALDVASSTAGVADSILAPPPVFGGVGSPPPSSLPGSSVGDRGGQALFVVDPAAVLAPDSPAKTSRSAQMLNLEKQALKVKQELMTAQIKLMQKRTAHLRATSSGASKTPKLRSISALGKVMAMGPILANAPSAGLSDSLLSAPHASALTTPQGGEGTVQGDYGEIALFLQNSFPEPVVLVAGHLMSLDSLATVIRSWATLLRTRLATSPSEMMDSPPGSPPPQVVDETGEYCDPDDYESSPPLLPPRGGGQSAALGGATAPLLLCEKYWPYESPLRVFKTYRFSRYFTHSAPIQGLLSLTFTNGLKPDRPICSFDLTSRCTKRSCPAQHFRDIVLGDSLVLEDFMLSLLTMPVSEPFANQTQLLVHVKNEFIKRSKFTQPLIVLVGVIMDTYRMMHKDGSDPHPISFQKVQSVSDLRGVIHNLSQMTTRPSGEPSVVVPFMDSRRCFLSGVQDLRGGVLPRLNRYWESKEERQACLMSLMENPEDTSAWLNLFLMTVSQGSAKDPQTLEAASKILRDALEAQPACRLMRTLWVDFERLRGNFQVETRYDDAGEVLPWLLLAGPRAVKPYSELKKDLQSCLSWALELHYSADTLVDFVLAGVRIACDNGDFEQAGLLLRSALGVPLPTAGPDALGSSLEASPPDRLPPPALQAYLWLMYYHLVVCATYPVDAFLSFPLELVRRTDFYYVIPWTGNPPGHDEGALEQLQLLLSALATASPFNGPIFEWVLHNYLGLCQVEACSPDPLLSLLAAVGSEAALAVARVAGWVDGGGGGGEEEGSLLQQSAQSIDPLAEEALHRTCQITMLVGRQEEPMPAGVDDHLRAYWKAIIGGSPSDELIQMHILRHLGVHDFVDLSALASADPEIYTRLARHRGDPMAWLLFILSIVRLSKQAVPASLVTSLLESGITNVGCPVATQVFLLCIWLVEGGEEQRGSTTLRMLALTEAASSYAQSALQRSWEELVAPYRLEEGPPLDFVTLNQRPVLERARGPLIQPWQRR